MLRRCVCCFGFVFLTAFTWAQIRPPQRPSPPSSREAQEQDLQLRMDQLHRLPLELNSQKQVTPQGAPAVISVLDLNVPEKARAEFNKGIKELQKREFAKAAGHFEKSVAIYPKFVAALNDLGVSYMYQGENDRAKEQFEAAARLNERVPMVYANLGRVCLAQQQFPEAEAQVRKAAALDPRSPEVLTLLAFTQFQNREYEDVVQTGRTIHQGEHKDFAIAHVVVAYAFESQGRLAEARREYETFVKEDPGNPRAPQAQQRASQLAEISGSLPK